MAGQSIRLYVKKQLRLDRLNFKQREMVEIGSAGLLSVFKRLSESKGPTDGPAMPLKKNYAIWKSRKGLGNRRNLRMTGQMLKSLKLRTVTENKAYASVGADARVLHGSKWKTVKVKKKGVWTGAFRNLTNKDIAWMNQQRERWLVFSPENRRIVIERAKGIFRARCARLVLSRKTGIDVG